MKDDLPIVAALVATGLRSWVMNLLESMRISRMLFSKAKKGARGKAATNTVTKPNWITETVTKPNWITENSHKSKLDN